MTTTPRTDFDFIIVGQGIAGSLLAYLLEQRGQRCLLIDAPEQTAASEVAAGIINPLTGRQYVKTWRADTLLPFARQFYRQLEEALGLRCYHPRNILRVFTHSGEENDWLARSAEPGCAPYMAPEAAPGAYAQYTAPCLGYGETLQTAQVDLWSICRELRSRWQQQDCWLADTFDYAQLQLSKQGVQYRQYQARQLVFCEGWRLRSNPYFNYLPLQGNKGEVLIVQFPEVAFDKMIKNKVFIAPLSTGDYWVGGSSHNHFADELPSEAGSSFVQQKLDEMIRTPYRVLAHRAAVRPTVRDRRPLLGRHPHHPQLAVFNGLGTKGASLAPYWAGEMVKMLLDGEMLDREVDIARFAKLLP